jgi:hypothetical protein
MQSKNDVEKGAEAMRQHAIKTVQLYHGARQLTDGTTLTADIIHEMLNDIIGDLRVIDISKL